MSARDEGVYQRLRRRADRLIHEPEIELAIVVMIVLSVALLVAEAVYPVDDPVHTMVAAIGDVLTWIFVLEISVRFWVARKKSRFFRRYWIDILAVLPVIRPFRFLRLLRLLRLFRAGTFLRRRVTLFQGVFQGALGELTLLGTVTSVLVVAATVVLYLVEHDHAPFSEATDAMWYSVFSLVAGEPVGGDPQTTLGRVTTLTLMFGGLTIFGMFIGTISASMVSRMSKRQDVQELDIDEQSNHVVVCGWNRTGRVMLQELFSRQGNQAVVLITELDQLPSDIPSTVIKRELLYHVSGDFTKIDVLERANIREAAAVIVLSDSLTKRSDQDRDARTVLAAMTIERLKPGIYACAELRNRENGSMLTMLGVEEIVVPEEYGGAILGSVSRNRGMMRVLDEILSVRHGNSFHKVAVPPAWIGRSVRSVFLELKEQHDALLVSVEVTREGKRYETKINPSLDYVLEPGSSLFVIALNPIEL